MTFDLTTPAIQCDCVHRSDLFESQRFELMVNSINDYAVYMLSMSGHIGSWSPGAQRLNGYMQSEIIGQHFSSLYTVEDQSAGLPARALYDAEHLGKSEFEGVQLRKDGTIFLAHIVIEPMKDDDGRLLGFANVTREIAERKHVDEALKANEQQFRLLVQSVTDYAIFMLDPNGVVTNWNSGAQHIKGYTENEIVGQHFSLFYTPEDREAGLPDRALATAVSVGSFEQEGWRLRKDGSRFMAHVLIDPIFTPTGELVGFAKVTRDITERVETAAALKRTEVALQQAQKMEAIGKLTGGVAHDFNNVLQIISGNLQLLAREVLENERAQDRLQSALGGVARGAKLANYLLAFGRRQALDPKVVNVGRFVNEMEDMLQRTLGESVTVKLLVNDDLWNTLVDLGQAESAVLNLSINARDAMSGSGTLTIEADNVFLDSDYAREYPDVSVGQYVMLAITDTGTGMSSEVMDRAFDPYFSTKPEGEGTGLGLSMVYGFVKQSGGHVEICSELGVGTTVKLYLPRSAEKQSCFQAMISREVVGGNETILVVEDDLLVCAVTVDMLTDLGYKVLQAHDATSALAIIESGLNIDLLFTDVVMPGPLGSTELAYKARNKLPNIGLLYTTGYTQTAIVHGGRLDAGVDLLAKPYAREDLARKVHYVLANQQQRREAAVEQVVEHPALLKAAVPLTVLLAGNDDLIRTDASGILELLGHVVIQAPDSEKALEVLAAKSIDALIIAIGLGGTPDESLAFKARELHPSIGIVLASEQEIFVGILRTVALRKPYNIATISNALQAALLS